jgi:polysaccharide deacetylase 2 family uncharacterized protein YibQ
LTVPWRAAPARFRSRGVLRAWRPATAALLALSLAGSQAALADSTVTRDRLPAISIIIDDLGYRRLDGLRAIELPGPIAYAILPHTPFATRLAGIAFQLDKALGPGALTSTMSRREIQAVLEAGLASVPHVSGINNHMGSALTRESRPMEWVMEWMRRSGELYFVDSYTSAQSVALRAARDAGLHAIGRDVFLDPTADTAVVERQFKRLIQIARERGTGLGIGHPYPETLSVLRRVLLKPSYYGVELVPVRELIARRKRRDAGLTPTAGQPSRYPTAAPQ